MYLIVSFSDHQFPYMSQSYKDFPECTQEQHLCLCFMFVVGKLFVMVTVAVLYILNETN